MEAGGSAPKKAAGKVMATVFWDFNNFNNFRVLLQPFGSMYKFEKNILAYNTKNNFSSRQRTSAQELFDHTPYSPDLASLGEHFYLFQNLKKFLAGKRFTSNEDAITVVNHYFEDLEENYFNQGIELVEKRWNKCIEVSGDYIEK